MIDVGKLIPRLPQAKGNGLTGQSRPMFDAAKALFLGGGDDLATAQQTGGRVAMIRIDPEYGGVRVQWVEVGMTMRASYRTWTFPRNTGKKPWHPSRAGLRP